MNEERCPPPATWQPALETWKYNIMKSKDTIGNAWRDMRPQRMYVYIYIYIYMYIWIRAHKHIIHTHTHKVKCSRYRPGAAQRVGRVIALLFHDRGTRRGWVVSSTPRPHFTPGKDPVPILQEAGWAPGPVWTGGKSRPHRDSIPDRPARSHSLHRLSYPAHKHTHTHTHI